MIDSDIDPCCCGSYHVLRLIRLFNVILLSMLLSACATTRQAYLPAAGYGMDGINEGDKVRIVMEDGKKHSLLVTRVDEIEPPEADQGSTRPLVAQ